MGPVIPQKEEDMIVVLFRPVEDAQPTGDGAAWVESLNGYPVDPGVGQHGGIILTEVRVGKPVITEHRTTRGPIGRDGKPTWPSAKIRHQMEVIRTEIGQDGKTPVYICKPVPYFGENMAKARKGWISMAFNNISQVPRNDVVEEPTVVEAPALAPEPGVPTVTPDPPVRHQPDEIEELKAQCRNLMAAGAPKISFRGAQTAKRYEKYIETNKEFLSVPNAAGAQPAS